MIACEKFEGRYTKGVVAQKLHDIFKKYNILDEVHFTTTETLYAIKDHGNCNESLKSLLTNDYLDDFIGDNDEMLLSPESVPSEICSVCGSANNEFLQNSMHNAYFQGELCIVNYRLSLTIVYSDHSDYSEHIVL